MNGPLSYVLFREGVEYRGYREGEGDGSIAHGWGLVWQTPADLLIDR